MNRIIAWMKTEILHFRIVEINKQADFDPGCVKVINNLRLML